MPKLPKEDLTGRTFGDLKVLGYAGKGKWRCQCSCENKTIKDINTTHLTGGYVKSCGHEKASNKLEDLKDKEFGDYIVIEYAGNSYWNCKCKYCNSIKTIRAYELKREIHTNCKCQYETEKRKGQTFYNWRLIEYLGDSHYKAKCLLCNRDFDVNFKNISAGKSKSCLECAQKQMVKNDLTDKTFGKLKVIRYIGGSKWLCQCDCKEFDEIKTDSLVKGKRTSCIKCYKQEHIERNLKDMIGKQIGNWEVIKYLGTGRWMCKHKEKGYLRDFHGYYLRKGKIPDSKYNGNIIDLHEQKFGELIAIDYVGKGYWMCECSCKNIVFRNTYDLRNGVATHCGCKRSDNYKAGWIKKYGEIAQNKRNNPRTQEQLQAIESYESLKKFIESKFDGKPTIEQLKIKLGLEVSSTLKNIHKLNAEDLVMIGGYTSKEEQELVDIVKYLIEQSDNPELTVITRSRSVIYPYELDIYIPELKLAIEFNGNYWHSDECKDKKYHINKTNLCKSKDIKLIHIFEYEWYDLGRREKLIELIDREINKNLNRVYARETEVKTISFEEKKKFLSLNHLQGDSVSDINLGCYYKDKLLGVMTFGKPRFNNDYEYELIRLCWNRHINVIGGSEKIFQYFVNKYNPTSIISYCDLSKFSGKVYDRLGFTFNKISEPNYVWVNTSINDVLTRYQTQKHKLVEAGLGEENQTEEEIMKSIGYIRIYDCGNKVFTWESDKLI